MEFLVRDARKLNITYKFNKYIHNAIYIYVSIILFSRLVVNKLIAECEKLAGRSITSRRRILDGVNFKVTLKRNDDLLQSNALIEKLITSETPLEIVKERHECELPDLHPIKCTITIPKKNIYTIETEYRKRSYRQCFYIKFKLRTNIFWPYQFD